MMLLPKTIGPVTLQRKLGTSGVSESYQGVLASDGRRVLIRRILPYLSKERGKLAGLEARVRDLLAVSHPLLVPLLDWVEAGDERLVVETWVEGLDLDRILSGCRAQGQHVPANVFLNLATQLCSALEVLHGRPGKSTGAENLLHLGLQPAHLFATDQARVVLGGFALTRSPTALSQSGVSSPIPQRLEYLSPDQTWPDQKLSCASDVFSLAAILHELLTLKPLFRADSSLQTIHQVRAADVSAAMVEVQARMPGLEKILARALNKNPSHRYQRAFVLREELRGLMASYDFSNIVEDTQRFLTSINKASAAKPSVALEPETTAAHILAAERIAKKAAQERDARAQREQRALLAAQRNELAEISNPPTELAEGPLPAKPRRVNQPAPTPFHPIPGGFGAAPPVPAPSPTLLPFEDDEPLLHGNEETTNVGFTAPPPVPQLPPSHGEVTSAVPAPVPPKQPAALSAGPRMAPAPRIAVPQQDPDDEVLETFDAPEGMPAGMNTWDPNAPLPVHQPDHEAPTAIPTTPPPIGAAAGGAATQPIPLAPAGPPPAATQPVQLKRNEGASTVITPLKQKPAAAPTAPPPIAAAPVAPPVQSPAPMDPEEPPKKRSMLLPVLGVLAAVLLISCLGAGTALWYYGNLAVDDLEDQLPSLAALDDPPSDAAVVATPPDVVPEEPAVAAVAEPQKPEAVQEPVKTPAVSTEPARSEPVRTEPVRTEPVRSEPVASPAASPPRAEAERVVREPRESSPSTKSAPATLVEDDPIADLTQDTGTPPAINLDGYADDARKGRLSASDVMNLEMVESSDASYTRSRALLLMNAEQDEDTKAVKRYLDQLMVLPENRYNSVYLSKQGVWFANRGSYSLALESASQAERYWARIPSALVFGTKADIYETKAAAYQGLFYASEDDLDLLDQAVDGWETYKRHMSSKGSSAEAERAQAQIDKLEDIRKRLE